MNCPLPSVVPPYWSNLPKDRRDVSTNSSPCPRQNPPSLAILTLRRLPSLTLRRFNRWTPTPLTRNLPMIPMLPNNTLICKQPQE